MNESLVPPPMQPLSSFFNAGIISDIEDSLGLSIPRVIHNGCLGAGCPPRGCRNAVQLMGEHLSHFTTARASYITPHHMWESVCPCNGASVRMYVHVAVPVGDDGGF